MTLLNPTLEEQAGYAYLLQVERVPKRSRFEWRDVEHVGSGRYTVMVKSSAETPTVAKWFRDAGLAIVRIDQPTVRDWFRVTFVIMGEGIAHV